MLRMQGLQRRRLRHADPSHVKVTVSCRHRVSQGLSRPPGAAPRVAVCCSMLQRVAAAAPRSVGGAAHRSRLGLNRSATPAGHDDDKRRPASWETAAAARDTRPEGGWRRLGDGSRTEHAS